MCGFIGKPIEIAVHCLKIVQIPYIQNMNKKTGSTNNIPGTAQRSYLICLRDHEVKEKNKLQVNTIFCGPYSYINQF